MRSVHQRVLDCTAAWGVRAFRCSGQDHRGDFHGSSLLLSFWVCVCLSLPWVGVAVDVVRLAPIQHGKSKTQLVTQVPTESGIIGSGQSLAISQVNLSTRRRGDNYSVLRHRRRGRRVQVACVPSVLAVCSREHEGQPVARGAVNSQRLQRQSIVTHQPAYITGVLDRNLIQTCAVFIRECLTAPRRGAFGRSGVQARIIEATSMVRPYC